MASPKNIFYLRENNNRFIVKVFGKSDQINEIFRDEVWPEENLHSHPIIDIFKINC